MSLRRLLMAAGGSTAVVLPSVSAFTVSASPSGGWTWFTDPRAVYYNGYTYYGYLADNGDVAVRRWDHATDTVSSEFVLHAALEQDDHDDPTLLLRDSDHKVLAFYTKHDDTQMRMRISSSAEDISAFAAEVNIDASLGGTDYTYPNPIQLLGETNDPIYLFYRDITAGNPARYDLVYGKSTDGGSTWASQVRLTGIDRAYWKIVQASDTRIDFAVTNTHPAYGNGSLYHFYMEGGAYFKSDGSSMGSPPFDESDMSLVYDGTSVPGWVWDIAIDHDGNPVIAFATFPSTTDHRYRYAAYDGGWTTHQVSVAGTYIPTATVGANPIETYYSGGIAIDRSDTRVVYPSVEVSAGRWDIYRMVTEDGGTSWDSTSLTSSGKNVRPVAVRNPDNGLLVVWMTGTYASYVDYTAGTDGAGY